MNSRRMLPGFHEPTAEALGDTTAEAITFCHAPPGSPLLVNAAGHTTRGAPPNSRRVYPNIAHANGAAPGSPCPPAGFSHAKTSAPTARTSPEAATTSGTEPPPPAAATATAARGTAPLRGFAAADDAGATPPLGAEDPAGAVASPIGPTDPPTAGESESGGVVSPGVGLTTVGATPRASTEGGRLGRLFPAEEPPELPPPRAPAPDPPASDPPRETPPRERAESLRGRTFVDAVADPDRPPASRDDDTDDPDEPAEPVVSANAAGIAVTAEPTPNATASAPTRPT